MEQKNETRKEVDKQRELDKKLPIDVLVTIGDSLHDCVASFVLANNNTPDLPTDNETTFVTQGSRKDMIMMFTEMFKENNEFVEIIMEAVVRYKLDKYMNQDAENF